MNNGDVSAMPTTAQCERCNSTHYKDEQTAGLTKREHFAGLAMQGILAGGGMQRGNEEWLTKGAVDMADALLAALDKGE